MVSEYEVFNQLSARQRELLFHALQSYIHSIRPITSAPLAAHFNVSSATVRNDLARLEEAGYLFQLHTSSGRLPTEKAYRTLVQELLSSGVNIQNHRDLIAELLNRVENEINILINSALILVAELTGQLAWCNLANNYDYIIKSLEIIELDSNRIMLALSLTYSTIKTRAIEIKSVPSRKIIQYLVDKFNAAFAGKALNDIDFNQLDNLFTEIKEYAAELIEKLTEFLNNVYLETGNQLNYTAAEKLLSQPEFQEAADKAVVVLSTLNRSELPINHRALKPQSAKSLVTQIGKENPRPELHDTSLVFANYQIGNRIAQIGVIGPIRMDYRTIIPIIAAAADYLNSAFE